MKPISNSYLRKDRGLALVLLLIILIAATAMGIWGLTSSRTSIQRSGSRKFMTELTYQAEQGLQKALRRIQTIAAGSTDQVAVTNHDTPGNTGGDYADKTMDFLITTMCKEADCGGTPNVACVDFDATKDFDVVVQNVNCNFLGVIDPNTQVSVVRKNDLTTSSGETFAVFLVNSVAIDTSGHKQAVQGVVVAPYSGTSSTGTPYIASSKAVSE